MYNYPVPQANDVPFAVTIRKDLQKKKNSTATVGKKLAIMSLVTGGVLDVGFSLIIPMLGGTFLGIYLDKRFGATPKFTLLLLFLGLILGTVNVYRLMVKLIKKTT